MRQYFVQPLQAGILLAGAEAMLCHREQSNGYPEAFHHDDGHLQIDVEKHRVLIQGKQVKLTHDGINQWCNYS
jgi:DNA-binding response OmpR family regulator